MFKLFTVLPILGFLAFWGGQLHAKPVTLYIAITESELDNIFHNYVRTTIEQNLPNINSS